MLIGLTVFPSVLCGLLTSFCWWCLKIQWSFKFYGSVLSIKCFVCVFRVLMCTLFRNFEILQKLLLSFQTFSQFVLKVIHKLVAQDRLNIYNKNTSFHFLCFICCLINVQILKSLDADYINCQTVYYCNLIWSGCFTIVSHHVIRNVVWKAVFIFISK